MWIVLAFGSALFAGETSILAKIGIKNTDSTVATAIRTIVVLLFSILMTVIVGSQASLAQINAKNWTFLTLSGISTGLSWLCYFKALQIGDVNKVTPIDKSSTVLTMILAMIFLNEEVTVLKILSIGMLAFGTILMVGKQNSSKYATGNVQQTNRSNEALSNESVASIVQGQKETSSIENVAVEKKSSGNSYLVFAISSAIFASLTAILSKVGITGVESNLGTAIRTAVVLVMAWIIVFARKKQNEIKNIDKKSWIFILLSGLTTGLSWICFYKALQEGQASVVVPIDKLSILVTMAFSFFVLKEKFSKKAVVGLAIIVAGTIILLI